VSLDYLEGLGRLSKPSKPMNKSVTVINLTPV